MMRVPIPVALLTAGVTRDPGRPEPISAKEGNSLR